MQINGGMIRLCASLLWPLLRNDKSSLKLRTMKVMPSTRFLQKASCKSKAHHGDQLRLITPIAFLCFRSVCFFKSVVIYANFKTDSFWVTFLVTAWKAQCRFSGHFRRFTARIEQYSRQRTEKQSRQHTTRARLAVIKFSHDKRYVPSTSAIE